MAASPILTHTLGFPRMGAQRELKTALERHWRGEIDAAALVVASWVRYAEGVDEKGDPIDVRDNDKERVMAAAQESKGDPLAFLRMEDYFGDLASDERFTSVYSTHLASLREHGARATLEAFMAEEG